MIEPEDMRRFERHIDVMIRKAGDDPAAFGQIFRLLTKGMAALPVAVEALREQGFSSTDMAEEVGIRPSSFRERFFLPAD